MMSDQSGAAPLRLILGSNNVYALRGDAGVTLIDAGPDYEGAWEELTAQLAAVGIGPGDVRTVALTHSHPDHAGLAARWQAGGARILIGHADAAALGQDEAAREAERRRARAALLRHGVPEEALAHRSAGERYTRWPAPLRLTALSADVLLDDGATISLAAPDTRHRTPDTLRVIACPGHTPGTILLLDEASGALFTGDHLLPRMAPTSGIQFDGERRRPSLPAYLASLRAARALPARHVYPGHGEPFADYAAGVDWTVRFLERRAGRVLAQLRRGPATAYALALRLFPHLEPRRLRPVLAETLGLLDLLAERGQAVEDTEGDPVHWRAVSTGEQDE